MNFEETLLDKSYVLEAVKQFSKDLTGTKAAKKSEQAVEDKLCYCWGVYQNTFTRRTKGSGSSRPDEAAGRPSQVRRREGCCLTADSTSEDSTERLGSSLYFNWSLCNILEDKPRQMVIMTAVVIAVMLEKT
ncbi:unnamed protein product [Diplocarpon coronariae]|nr:hypothetical protein JHW43_009359 [Diplocarpon mali]